MSGGMPATALLLGAGLGGMQYVYSMLVKCRYRSVSADRRLDLGELRQVLTPCWLLTKAAVRSALRIC